MGIVIGEDAFDRLPQTLRMRQDLSDPVRRSAVREEYKQGLPKFYPDIAAELHLTADRFQDNDKQRDEASTAAEPLEANIRANEDSLPELQAASGRLLQQVTSFLTPRQLPIPGQAVFISAQSEDAPETPESRH